MLADVIQPCSRASRVARFTEWAIPASSAWITRRRASRGYPSRYWVVVVGEGAPMNDMLQRQRWFWTRHLHLLSAVGMSVLFALAVCGTALGQEPAAQIEVSGKVTTPEGHPISGVTVRVRGGSTNTTTDAQGNYSILAPLDGVLTFNLIGFRGTGLGIAGRTTMNVALDRAMAV